VREASYKGTDSTRATLGDYSPQLGLSIPAQRERSHSGGSSTFESPPPYEMTKKEQGEREDWWKEGLVDKN